MNVSHETFADLETLASEILRWNDKINLIGRGTTQDVLGRHIEDSLQLSLIATPWTTWCDLGSGGGLPGLVIAITMKGTASTVVMIESDMRKATFLTHISTLLKLNTQVLAERIESADPVKSDVISARALAPLPKLLAYAHRHQGADTTFLFPKGARYEEEILAAKADWRFSVEAIPSTTSQASAILKIKDLARV